MYAPGSLHILSLPALRAHLAQQCPFYYNWVVFVVAASTSYAARPLMSVAVLSVFMVPMTDAFGWSRGLLAGAVSLGGVCAVVISPPRQPSDRSIRLRVDDQHHFGGGRGVHCGAISRQPDLGFLYAVLARSYGCPPLAWIEG
jgi:hypothetical protein